MKIQTADLLFDRIADDLSWRKKEISVFASQVAHGSPDVKRALLRAGVAMLYAHWEGFVKNSCHWYLCFLASRRLTFQQARPELAALAIRGRLTSLEPSKRIQGHVDVVRMIREEATSRLSIPTDREDVRTESNLSYRVLMDLLTSIGCPTEAYEQYEDLIDENLVSSRNRVAHGEGAFIAETEWSDLRDKVVMLMDQVANQVIDAAANELYFAWRA